MSKPMVKLEVIPADALEVDPDVQFDFALNERRWRTIGANYDMRKQGVLEVTPNGDDTFYVFDGRHRLLGGRDIAGVREFRCNVHRPSLSISEKAAIKLGLDKDRRNVSAVESFLASVLAGDPESIAIKAKVVSFGYEIGHAAGDRRTRTFEAVAALRKMHRADTLDRVLALNENWKGEPRTTTGTWILGLHQFCVDGYDAKIRENHAGRLAAIVPSKILRIAQGKATMMNRTSGTSGGEIAHLISQEIRSALQIRLRPASK